jgi:hypothetical protein
LPSSAGGWWLKSLAFSGQPAPERVAAVRTHPGRDVETQLTEVIGQRKLLKWSVPGAAHAATFWGFIVLLLTIIEAYGNIFSCTFAIPGIGHWAAIGFLEDLFSVGVLCGVITFAVIRLRSDPHKEGRKSRFFGSHTGAAWLVLGMIALVIITLLLYRGAQQETGVFPYPHAWAFGSWVFGKAHRCKNQGFCCGAGGARMWLEERIGKRINTERIDEALALDSDTISTACPYCMVMLGDAINEKKASGQAKDSLEVIDVAQLLVRSTKFGENATGDTPDGATGR